jgi:hypothetical protein
MASYHRVATYSVRCEAFSKPRLSPKSHILSSQSALTTESNICKARLKDDFVKLPSKFPGFKSRCRTPAECTNFIPTTDQDRGMFTPRERTAENLVHKILNVFTCKSLSRLNNLMKIRCNTLMGSNNEIISDAVPSIGYRVRLAHDKPTGKTIHRRLTSINMYLVRGDASIMNRESMVRLMRHYISLDWNVPVSSTKEARAWNVPRAISLLRL